MKDIIAKAVEGGYRFSNVDHVYYEEEPRFLDEIFFSHDFLRAFFGESIYCHVTCSGITDNVADVPFNYSSSMSSWQHHAQQLVLSEDRIKYLEGFLE